MLFLLHFLCDEYFIVSVCILSFIASHNSPAFCCDSRSTVSDIQCFTCSIYSGSLNNEQLNFQNPEPLTCVAAIRVNLISEWSVNIEGHILEDFVMLL